MIAMNESDERQLLNEAIHALKKRGFEPWEQIKRYVAHEDDS